MIMLEIEIATIENSIHPQGQSIRQPVHKKSRRGINAGPPQGMTKMVHVQRYVRHSGPAVTSHERAQIFNRLTVTTKSPIQYL